MSRRGPLIVGNWKMCKTGHEASAFISEFGPVADRTICQVYIAAPFTALEAAGIAAKDHKLLIGAQTLSEYDGGPYTGEISALMLRGAGARFTLIGHSERRSLYNEGDSAIHQKLKAALRHQIQPILCIGETQRERDEGKTKSVLEAQISAALGRISALELSSLILAYEPVWAIGTGRSATPENAEEVHTFCRQVLSSLHGSSFSEEVPLLYGGSVNHENGHALMSMPNIDGALVGKASLTVDTFTKIILKAEEAKQ